MIQPLRPPAERELPPGRHAEMRARILNPVGEPGGIPRSIRIIAVTAVVTAAVGALAIGDRDGNDRPAVLAFGEGEISPRLRQAIQICEERAWVYGGPDAKPRLVNRGEAGDRAIVVFLTDSRMVACTDSGGHYGPYKQAHWLPGPISVESASGGDGDVSVAGRISKRVARVELEHGDGRKTIARLAEGTFAVATADARIRGHAATLVTYDRAGAVIDRRPALFLHNGSLVSGTYRQSCWTDLAGAVVYGTAGPDCKPADPWP